MAQAGIHGMVGMLTRKVTGKKDWLLLGAMLGSLVPDMDNLGVAYATLAKLPTTGIHRYMTHSVFIIAAVVIAFLLVGQIRKEARWANLGWGLGLGMLLHSLLDLLIWFNGVALFWPFPLWINLWANYTPADWWMKLMDPAEFLCLGLYLWVLGSWARKAGTDGEFLNANRNWMILEFVLFVVFTPLVYIMTTGFRTLFGAFYLFSLLMAFFVTIRMRKTVEAVAA
jgi:membrane-bound metal-dependent hydrolase YbcI (DUF457 family)